MVNRRLARIEYTGGEEKCLRTEQYRIGVDIRVVEVVLGADILRHCPDIPKSVNAPERGRNHSRCFSGSAESSFSNEADGRPTSSSTKYAVDMMGAKACECWRQRARCYYKRAVRPWPSGSVSTYRLRVVRHSFVRHEARTACGEAY